jgi:gliding motility-associated-like protein
LEKYLPKIYLDLEIIYKMKKYFCLIVFSYILFLHQATAQEAEDYAYSTNKTSSLIVLSNPTVLINAGATNLTSAVTPIGFEFWFMGVRYTSFSINANGAIQLGTNPILPAGNAYGIPNVARIIAMSSGDRNATTGAVIGDWRVSANGGVIHYQLFGNAPNRTLVVECRNMNLNFQSTTNDATFQIILHETAPLPNANNRGGRIEFRYGQVRSSFESNSFRIGIGASSNRNQFRGVDISVNPPTSPITDDIIENRIGVGVITALDGDTDGNRRVFVFEPPYPNAQAINLRSSCAGEAGAVQLDWENTASNAVGSVLYRSTDGTNFAFLTQIPRGTTTYTDRGLNVGTVYTYRVFSVTEGKLCELHPTAQLEVDLSKSGILKKLEIAGRPVICNGVAELETEAGYDTYEWYDSQENLVISSDNPKVTFREAGTYRLIARADSLGACVSIGEVTITECCSPVLVLPNAFTPHSTPANNIFRVRHENLTKFRMQIYNRWGVLVFETDDPEEGWNGYFQGRPAQADAYQVVVEYTGCEDGKIVRGKKQGVLNLLE